MGTITRSVPVANIRAVVSRLRKLTNTKRKGGECYRLDRCNGTSYLAGHRKMEKKVYTFLQSLRSAGEPIVYIDVCGRAKLDFADINYSFSLQENYWAFEQTPERRVGDLFSAKDFYGFLRMIKGNDHRPSLVTCEPVAGLDTYSLEIGKKTFDCYKAVLYQRLENNLRAMIELLRPGGFIYLTRVLPRTNISEFFARIPQDEYMESRFIKALCKSMHCSVEIEPTICGPAFLIRKWLR